LTSENSKEYSVETQRTVISHDISLVGRKEIRNDIHNTLCTIKSG
jgi:hypothetical protein